MLLVFFRAIANGASIIKITMANQATPYKMDKWCRDLIEKISLEEVQVFLLTLVIDNQNVPLSTCFQLPQK